MWIERQISEKILSNADPIQVVRGPRQCGKSSLILRLSSDYVEISLDDLNLRQLAQSDPNLLLSQFGDRKLFIDEAQYAPALFPELKRRADLYKRSKPRHPETIVRLTGSNQILLDQNVKESLAGRASFFDMNTLTVAEILNSVPLPIQTILYTGGWPELYAQTPVREPRKYLDDYINSYIERDIIMSAGIQKQAAFLKLVRLLAGRVGQIVDFSSFGAEAGVDAKTAREWISILERMRTIALVPPYFSNLSSRLTKSPKLYFIDTGLACRLQGWTSPEIILTSPQQGGLFENLVFSEIYKLNLNYQLGWTIYHWRSKDKEEIDFLIDKGPAGNIFLEAKVSAQKIRGLDTFPEVQKVFGKKKPPLYLCHMEGSQILAGNIPIAKLSSFLLGHN
jgi:predicted AAA+ superfamily ATPase